MTPQQALNVVAQMVAATPATYAEHTMAQQALVVLKDAIEPKEAGFKPFTEGDDNE